MSHATQFLDIFREVLNNNIYKIGEIGIFHVVIGNWRGAYWKLAADSQDAIRDA